MTQTVESATAADLYTPVVQAPIPINYMFTQDYVMESLQDQVIPDGVLTAQDLDVKPRSILLGEPIEHIRHFRVGGYELGTTGGGHGMAGSENDGGRATT